MWAGRKVEIMRIYVADLAAYNAGKLHGVWIDLEGKDKDDIWKEINEMLSDSPASDAEEWAVHDHEGFGKYDLDEYPDLDDLVQLVSLAEEHGEIVLDYIEAVGFKDLRDAGESFEESYAGEWDTEEEFAENLFEDTGDLEKVPEFLRYHIDWEGVARDLFMDDYFPIEKKNKTHVFRNI
jgi:antirestriction protein